VDETNRDRSVVTNTPRADALVSIAIPAYNHGGYLAQAIESVLAQDYPHIELIVLDDGSTDNTRDVLARYSGRFFWETQPNMGQARTLNRAWNLSHGEILGYLSADDILMPGAVHEAVNCLADNPDTVACYCDFDLIDPQGRVIRHVKTPEFDYRHMLAAVVCPLGPGAFFRRTALEKAGGWDPDLRQMPDYDFWLRLGLQGKFKRIPRVLAGFRVHEQSQTFSRTSPDRAEEPVFIISRFFKSRDLSESLKRLEKCALSNAHLISCQLHFRAGRFRSAIQHLRKAFGLNPAGILRAASFRILANAIFNRAGHRLLWQIKNVLLR
jgi:glycosyltransferase involved in cell wall biosynthesis